MTLQPSEGLSVPFQKERRHLWLSVEQVRVVCTGGR
jgi:hypothetical protein